MRYYTTGTPLTLRARARDATGKDTDAATATCQLRHPDGKQEQLAVRHADTGQYEADPPTTTPGVYRWRWELEDPSVAAEGVYTVTAPPGQ